MASKQQRTERLAGGKPDKLIRNALLLAVNREYPTFDGKKLKYINIIADKLVEKASGGDVAAIKEIADRIDGKSAQQLNVAGANGESLQMTVTHRVIHKS